MAVREQVADLLPMAEEMFADAPNPSQLVIVELVAIVGCCAPPGLASVLPLFGPELRHIDQVVTNYRWPEWHHKFMEDGAVADALMTADPGFFIKCVLP